MKRLIYLDYAATTPVDPQVASKMAEFLTLEGCFGNPASSHVFGQPAKKAVDEARAQVAELIHAEPAEIIWTSGATEANNLALKGAAELYQRKGKHIITLKTEHPAVLDSCQQLEKEGFFVTYLTPEKNGRIDLDKLKAAIQKDTILISIMHVNNEIGVIQDIDAIAVIAAEQDILYHVDAAQSAGKIAIDLQKTPVHLMSFCAHKLYGPKGIGALYVRRKPRVKVAAQLHGGGQEQGMRSGTLPTHQIVGMGEAFALAKSRMTSDYATIAQLRQRFWDALSPIKTKRMNGDIAHTVPHILNICFPTIKATDLMQALPQLAISAGSACNTKGIEPSHVLRAIGLNVKDAECSLRFSFGRYTTNEEIDSAAQLIIAAIK